MSEAPNDGRSLSGDISIRRSLAGCLLIFVVSYGAMFLCAYNARRFWLDANYCNGLKFTPVLQRICVGNDLPQREGHPMRWPR